MQKEHKFLFFKDSNILERNSYEYFKKNKRFTHKDFDEHRKWLAIARGLVMVMNKLYKQSDEGLYLTGIGYFTYLPKYKIKGRRISVVRRKKDKFYYEESFIPFCNELLSYRIEGVLRTDKVIIPNIANLDFADQFEKQHKLLRGYMSHHKSAKYKLL